MKDDVSWSTKESGDEEPWLAAAHGVAFDEGRAHSAAYDVEITVACLRKIKA